MRPFIQVLVLLFRRSAPSRSLTAASTIMVNGSLSPLGNPAVLLSAPLSDLLTGWRGSLPFFTAGPSTQRGPR